MAAFLEHSLDAAYRAGATGVIIDINTLGGRVDAALQMRDAIIYSRVPVVVYVGTRAISAGALIAIASDTIIMAPGSHMGSAEPYPLDPKTLAFVSSEFRTTAERTGRDPEIAAAMVDRSIVIEGLVGEGEILDLTAIQAAEWGYADHIAAERGEILRIMGWEGSRIVEVQQNIRFRIGQFLTSYEVATLLLTFGMLGMVAELFTPGFGVAGFIGIGCFALYFASGLLVGTTDYWAAMIFVIGVILLTIELFMPGFGVFGITGLAALFVGVVLAAPNPAQGIGSLLIASGITIVSIPVFLKIFGKTRFLQRFVLASAETADKGYTHATPKIELLGQIGVTQTVLRPSGSVIIDGRRVDALADGAFIDSGVSVKVIEVVGTKIVVIEV